MDILSEIRDATSDAHRRLEDAVQIERRIAVPVLYRRLLEVFFGFYRPLENGLRALHGLRECAPDLSDRWKTTWLEGDLLELGLSRSEIIALPDCTALPSVGSPGRGYGCF